MSGFVKIIEYPVNDAVFMANGIKLELVQSAKEKSFDNALEITAFGDAAPSMVQRNYVNHEVELVRTATPKGTEFLRKGEFTLTIAKSRGSVEFRGCRLSKYEALYREGEPTLETITIKALSRKEV